MKKIYSDYDEFAKDRIQSSSESINNHNSGIKSDFWLVFSLIKELIIYLLLLIPNLFLLILAFISGKSEMFSRYFKKVFFEPFYLILKIKNWFFQAKYTAFLIIFLLIMFIVQILFINTNDVLLNMLRTNTSHLFEGNYISVLTSVFLHGNLFHLLTNLLALLIFGRIVENHFGIRILYIFIFSGVFSNIISNMISYAIGDSYYSLGASGGIAGLIIFAILLQPFALTTILLVPLPIFLIGWFLIFLDIFGLFNPSQTNHLAHLSGYAALIVLFFFLEVRHKKNIMKGFLINFGLLILLYIIFRFFIEELPFALL